MASNALSWQSGTGYFGVGFVLFTAVCNSSKIWCDCGEAAVCGKTFQKETALENPSDIKSFGHSCHTLP